MNKKHKMISRLFLEFRNSNIFVCMLSPMALTLKISNYEKSN